MEDPRERSGRQPSSVLPEYDTVLCVAGSRSFNNYDLFVECLEGRILQEDLRDMSIIFVSGKAHSGADAMIIRWCEENGFPWVEFPADWDNLEAPGAVIRKNKRGKPYNAVAGHMRNIEMAKASTHVLLFYDGFSKGTKHMYDEVVKRKLDLVTILVDPDDVPTEPSISRESNW